MRVIAILVRITVHVLRETTRTTASVPTASQATTVNKVVYSTTTTTTISLLLLFIGLGDGVGSIYPTPFGGNIFSGKYHVKFGQFRANIM